MYTTSQLFNLEKTIAAEFFKGKAYPWQILPGLAANIVLLGQTLPTAQYTKIGHNIWLAKDATIAPTASINGPCIVCSGAEIRHCAYIRGGVIVGKNAVVGNSTELKNALLFNCVQVPHFNYIGDSVLGYKAHFGAGVITANVRSDKADIFVKAVPGAHCGAGLLPQGGMQTGLAKLGAMVGDYAEIGCNSVLAPGSIVGRHTTVYPTTFVRGTLPHNSILKQNGSIVQKAGGGDNC